ncbi:MAG: YHS domain-containing (seleno)protein [Planctomycetota bacterium]
MPGTTSRPTGGKLLLTSFALAMAVSTTGLAAAAGAVLLEPPTASELAAKPRDTGKYEIGKNKLAIGGYDPVAYFPEGGAKPAKGKKSITLEHRGVKYRFASESNLELFKSNPNKYEPAYGGWCAYAAAKETYTEPNPKRFKIQGGRLLLFYDGFFGDTYEDWHKEGPDRLEVEADDFWKAETRELPRTPANEYRVD